MNPMMKQVWTSEELTRQGIRGIDNFTAEELALLQDKVAEWIRQGAPQTARQRQSPSFVSKPRSSEPA